MGPRWDPDGTWWDLVESGWDPASKKWDPVTSQMDFLEKNERGGTRMGPASKTWDPVTTQMGLVWENGLVATPGANLDLQDMTTCALQMPMMPPGHKSCAAQHLIYLLALYKGC